MTAITFDTLKFVQTLRESGVDNKQAEAIAAAVRETHDSADLATKRDLKELELQLNQSLKELELRLTLRLGALVVAAIGIVAALVKLL
jgi:hypothetical protein